MVELVQMISCFQLCGLSHLPFVFSHDFYPTFYNNFTFDSYLFDEIRARYKKFHKSVKKVCSIIVLTVEEQ